MDRALLIGLGQGRGGTIICKLNAVKKSSGAFSTKMTSGEAQE